MFTYDKRRIIRLYSDGKSYVLTSQLIENQTLHIKLVDSCVCINKITNDEWMAMKQRSGINSFSLINESYGCIGILTIASDERASSYLNSLIFVKEAVSVGSIRKFDIIRITDVFILPLQAEINTYMYQQQQSNSNTKESSGQHNDVRKFLSSGNFYYAYSQEPGVSFDLTLSAQARHLGHATDKKFLWNYNFHIPFILFPSFLVYFYLLISRKNIIIKLLFFFLALSFVFFLNLYIQYLLYDPFYLSLHFYFLYF